MENSTTPHSQASPVGDDSPRNQRLFGGIQRVNTNIQSPSVSLIQSAVRSILDDATPSTILSDDNSDHPRNKAGSTNSFFPSLESLRMERPPPIPSDQDRKCFLVSPPRSWFETWYSASNASLPLACYRGAWQLCLRVRMNMT